MNKDNTPPHNDEQPSDEKRKQTLRQRKIRYALSYLFVALVAVWLIEQFVVTPLTTRQLELPYSEFKAKIKAGQVIDVTLGQGRIAGHLKDPARAAAEPIPFTTIAVPDGDPTLIADLDAAGVAYQAGQTTNNTGRMLLSFLFPLSLLGGVWYFVYSGAGKGGRSGLGGVMGAGRSKAMQVAPEKIGITFQDVGGADEAIAELREITQFLTKPEQFARLGGRIPKGVLLVGPPGTGKTLLAKATAGEANAPFFETSGSEFVEMFVGVGAARVRDLFKQARKAAPAIIFIDEIDAIGQARGGRMRSSGNDEREQTLNQLLSEIDGFRSELSKPIIIIAATNRPEDLDPALLRAGRFDRQVTVSAPDLCGRLQILSIHTRKLDLSPDFDVERAARMTPGFTGADLANAMNEAALLAARRDADAITMQDFEAAIERVVAGLEKKSRLMNELERITVAYHESGHALVAELLPHADPVAKVSIVPRGRGALGYCLQMPVEDRYLLTCEELEDRIAVMLGGRAAELIVRHVVSTGASDDIKRATELARRMVTEFGMSQKLGTVCYATRQYEFLEGAEGASAASPDTLKMIDEEIQRIVEEQYQRAQGLLSEHRDALERLARQLLQTETVDGAGIKEALAA